jgi:hypothetical protein
MQWNVVGWIVTTDRLTQHIDLQAIGVARNTTTRLILPTYGL